MAKEKVFILLKEKFATNINQNILVKEIGDVYCKDEKIQKDIENLKIIKTRDEEDWDYIKNTDIANKVLEYDPKLDIEILGANEILIEIKSQEKDNTAIQFIKVFLICLVLFFGAGIAIVNFYEDVNMVASLNAIYYFITGTRANKPLIFTIPYTIGLGLGVITFFTRVISSSKRRRKEPGPMELELYLYDSDVEDYILNDIKKTNSSNK